MIFGRGDIVNVLHSLFMNEWARRNATDTSAFKSPTRTVFDNELALVVLFPESYVTIGFQFVPDSLKYSRNADFNEVKIVSRNTPKYQYNGGSTSVSFRLDFYAEQEDRQDVIDRCRAIEALTYSDGYDNPNPRVRLVWGALFRDEVWIVKTVNYELLEFKPNANFLPQQAYLDITLLRIADNNLKWSEVR